MDGEFRKQSAEKKRASKKNAWTAESAGRTKLHFVAPMSANLRWLDS
jgi:hypothetical protein